VENQVQYAIDTGNMPASEAAYDDAALLEAFPPDLLQAYRDSIDTAGPRPSTPYWNKVVSAILNEWHPADGVNPDSTPANSQTYVEDVLKGEALS
jgi:multiple sugar transport system substrate-binding protein